MNAGRVRDELRLTPALAQRDFVCDGAPPRPPHFCHRDSHPPAFNQWRGAKREAAVHEPAARFVRPVAPFGSTASSYLLDMIAPARPGTGSAAAATPADIADLVPCLRRFAGTLCGNRADADDLVQIACEKALTRLHQFQPGTRLDSWMIRIVQTSFIDGLRAGRRVGTPAQPETLERLTDDGLGARRGDDRLHLIEVRRAVAGLPPEQRAVLALVAIESYSYKEAAEILDTPVGTVMSRLSRARSGPPYVESLCDATKGGNI